MDTAAIQERIKAYLEEVTSRRVDLNEDSDLLQSCFTDSIMIVDAVLFLEKEFGIRVKRADINARTFATLGAIAAYVADRLQDTRA